jgi:hypothetical protein
MKLKKQTPDFIKAKFDKDGKLISKQIGIQKKDLVSVLNKKSLINNRMLNGKFYFDSFDSLDNTIYICPTHTMSFTYCVNLTDVERVETWKDTIPN